MSNYDMVLGLLKAVVGILVAIFLVMMMASAIMNSSWF